MIIHRGSFSVEIVDALSRTKCEENTEPTSGEVFVRVDPKAHYLVRLCVLDTATVGRDPERIFLAYVNINDEYIGYRQCLSQREGYMDVSFCSTMIGVNEPIRFQDAKLLETSTTCGDQSTSSSGGARGFHTSILHMGKVTVKIYEGICDRRQSAFGNNVFGTSAAYQPGRYVDTLTIHCCATPEDGHSFLNVVDSERLKKALMKRGSSSDSWDGRFFKRVKTDTGYISVVPPSAVAGATNVTGMECDMVLQQQPAAFPLA